MQAPDQGPGSAAGGDEGHSTPGDSGGPDGPAGHEGAGRGDEGEAGAVACGAQARQAPIPGGNTVPGPGDQAASERSGEAGPTAGGPGREPVEYCLRVPFPSPMEAEMARQSLASHGEQQQGAVQKEFIVSGNILVIRLTAEDPGLLQNSIATCQDQLSLLIQNAQYFMTPFFAKPKQ
ncbi:hypothetical protein mRhiFer1_007818 [Rhinolophus ferrumequinum]|uniref:L antigen family member 3 n=1 Tax=Rhinolophus ferrumequinum TaxID=59479 RepID=A0A7J8AUY1_RHIFE|nr:hypothetical protein mRhiFer1_007818 [Rhinolophus ferrumequinum]